MLTCLLVLLLVLFLRLSFSFYEEVFLESVANSGKEDLFFRNSSLINQYVPFFLFLSVIHLIELKHL